MPRSCRSPGVLAGITFIASSLAQSQALDPSVMTTLQGRPAVVWGRGAHQELWARGHTYKAGFGDEGFVYVPFLGADAPRSFPVHFTRFTRTNAVTDVPFVFVGLQAPATTWCGTCRLGVLQGSVLTTTLGPTLDIRIPADLRMLGGRVAVQGLAFGSGPCSPDAMRLSDTIDVTVL